MPDKSCVSACPEKHALTAEKMCVPCPSKCLSGCEEDNNYQIVCAVKCAPG